MLTRMLFMLKKLAEALGRIEVTLQNIVRNFIFNAYFKFSPSILNYAPDVVIDAKNSMFIDKNLKETIVSTSFNQANRFPYKFVDRVTG